MRTAISTALAACAVLAFLTATGPRALAADYPSKPIVLVSQASAGSAMDLFCRMVAKLAPKYVHQTIVVENRTGGDGAVAMEYLLSQPSDGYTLLAITRSFATTLDTDLKDKFKPDDFSFVASMVGDSYVLSVSTDSPYKTIKDFLAAAKTTPLTVAGFGTNSAEGIFARRLAQESGAKLNWVPYPGGAAAIAPVLGNHIAAVLNHPGDVKSFVESGKLRVLAASNDAAIKQFPNAVTFRSLGYRDLTAQHYRGVITKAGISGDVARRLDDLFKHVSKDPEFVQYMKQTDVEPYYNDSRAFTNIVRSDMDIIARQMLQK